MYSYKQQEACLCLLAISSLVSHAAAAKSLQSCLTLCNPIDGSPPGSPVPGILQARTLEWVAISSSNAWKWKVKVKSVMFDSLQSHGLQPTRPLCPWIFQIRVLEGVSLPSPCLSWRHAKCSAVHSSVPLSQKILHHIQITYTITGNKPSTRPRTPNLMSRLYALNVLFCLHRVPLSPSAFMAQWQEVSSSYSPPGFLWSGLATA